MSQVFGGMHHLLDDLKQNTLRQIMRQAMAFRMIESNTLKVIRNAVDQEHIDELKEIEDLLETAYEKTSQYV